MPIEFRGLHNQPMQRWGPRGGVGVMGGRGFFGHEKNAMADGRGDALRDRMGAFTSVWESRRPPHGYGGPQQHRRGPGDGMFIGDNASFVLDSNEHPMMGASAPMGSISHSRMMGNKGIGGGGGAFYGIAGKESSRNLPDVGPMNSMGAAGEGNGYFYGDLYGEAAIRRVPQYSHFARPILPLYGGSSSSTGEPKSALEDLFLNDEGDAKLASQTIVCYMHLTAKPENAGDSLPIIPRSPSSFPSRMETIEFTEHDVLLHHMYILSPGEKYHPGLLFEGHMNTNPRECEISAFFRNTRDPSHPVFEKLLLMPGWYPDSIILYPEGGVTTCDRIVLTGDFQVLSLIIFGKPIGTRDRFGVFEREAVKMCQRKAMTSTTIDLPSPSDDSLSFLLSDENYYTRNECLRKSFRKYVASSSKETLPKSTLSFSSTGSFSVGMKEIEELKKLILENLVDPCYDSVCLDPVEIMNEEASRLLLQKTKITESVETSLPLTSSPKECILRKMIRFVRLIVNAADSPNSLPTLSLFPKILWIRLLRAATLWCFRSERVRTADETPSTSSLDLPRRIQLQLLALTLLRSCGINVLLLKEMMHLFKDVSIISLLMDIALHAS
ncbi:hypothetical protein IE077_002213, partial [Cardiosporidium cionae]